MKRYLCGLMAAPYLLSAAASEPETKLQNLYWDRSAYTPKVMIDGELTDTQKKEVDIAVFLIYEDKFEIPHTVPIYSQKVFDAKGVQIPIPTFESMLNPKILHAIKETYTVKVRFIVDPENTITEPNLEDNIITGYKSVSEVFNNLYDYFNDPLQPTVPKPSYND